MRFPPRFRRGEVADEMRAHREMLEEEFRREGMSPREAAAAARRRMGNELGSLEESRDQWGFRWLEALLRDARFALRQMRSQPVLTAAAVVIAGLGVGANTAIVSVLETVMLKPLGLRDSDRVMVATVRIEKVNIVHATTSAVEFRELSSMTDVFQSVAAAEGSYWTLQGGGEPRRLRGRAVTPDFFRVFGETPRIGRFFHPDDTDALVLSYQFWKSEYGGDPGVLGRKVTLDNSRYRIVGVANESFRFPSTADAWTSLVFTPQRLRKRGWAMSLTLLCRLKDGVPPRQAADRVNRYVAAFKASPDGREMNEYRYGVDLESFGHFVAGDLGRPLLLLWGAALAVLLTACANIAVLLLSRAAGRRKEIAIRLSIGATRVRILRQLAVESLLLGAFGGAFGIAVSGLALSFASRVAIPSKALFELVTLDWRLIAYGMALSMASGLLFGLAPAVQLLRSSQAGAMTRGARHHFQNLFIAGQVAAALVLLIATGLLLRSLWSVESIHPGFDPENLTTALLITPQNDAGFTARLENALRSTPGIESGAIAYPLPFTNGGLTSGFAIKGRPQRPEDVPWHGEAWFVSPSFFETLGIRVLRGRALAASDTADSAPVCVVDRNFADRFFPDQDPLGHEISMYGPMARIVGVVADIRSATLEHDARPGVYYSALQQQMYGTRGIVIRTRLPALPLIRDAVCKASLAAPIFDLLTMRQRIDESMGIRRVVATLVCIFAGICILLAAIGLHGVVTQVVGERSGEIAVRMALGAQPAQIFRRFLEYGLRAGAAGIAVGIGLALYAERLLGSLLYDVKPFDAATFAAAAAGVVIVLSVSVFWPARRASRMQPRNVLRHE